MKKTVLAGFLILFGGIYTLAYAHNGAIHATEEEERQHEQEVISEESIEAAEGFGAAIQASQETTTENSDEIQAPANAEFVPVENIDGKVPVHFFGRDDCKFCKAQKEYLDALLAERSDFEVVWYDIIDDDAAHGLYSKVTEAAGVSKITPVTVIGDQVFQGFDTPETTGKLFVHAINNVASISAQERKDFRNLETALQSENFGVTKTGRGCDESGTECGTDAPAGTYLNIPFLGPTNLETFSLFTLSGVLGFIDGFNPCAMWVLITFLLILLQVGDRKKMFIVAGVFIVAEAVMYNLILNVWYQTWDFVKLDSIVTPLVGFIAIGGGLFFLWRYHKERQALTCDITDLETQGKITQKIKNIASGPMSIVALLGIVGIAFSVNIIEFACSIGIPQAFTKILELNELSFLERQFYIGIYTIFYMIDDFIVFALALYGFDKLHQSGGKYIRLSLLIGGILMILLGALLLFNPEALVF